MKIRMLLIMQVLIGAMLHASAAEKVNVEKKGGETVGLVEVVVRFVALQKEKVDEILIEDVTKALNVEDITRLLKEGHGSILASPQVITPFGIEGEVQGGVKHRFPQDYDIEMCCSDSERSFSCVGKPQDWEDLTIGPHLKVTPKRTDDGKKICIDLSTNLSWDLGQDAHPIPFSDSKSPISTAYLPLPSVMNVGCQTIIETTDGETHLISGGIPNRTGEDVIYVLLTCKTL